MLAAVAVAAAALLGWAFAPKPVAVEVAQATTGRYEQAVVEDGRTRLRDRYVVAAPLAGRLARTALREGDAVAAGQVLAEITPLPAPMLDARTRSELEARRAGAEAGVRRAAAAEGQQRVAVTQARTALGRSEALAQQGFIAPTLLDNDRLAVAAAQQGMAAAEQTRRVAEHELQVARAALQVSQVGAGGGGVFAVRSPVAGRVLKVAQTSETTVVPGTPLMELGDTARLEVLAELLTPDALVLAPGALVRIDRWGGPGELQARVRRVEPAAFTKVSALGVEEQRVNVLIDLTSPPEQWTALGDGYRVGVRILTRVKDDARMVPVSAVFPRPGQGRIAPAASAPSSGGASASAEGLNAVMAGEAAAVFVVEAGRARLRHVMLGGRNGVQAWVQEGLRAGEAVIVYPPAEVADGVRVQTRDGNGR